MYILGLCDVLKETFYVSAATKRERIVQWNIYRSSPEFITATRRLEDGGGTQRALC